VAEAAGDLALPPEDTAVLRSFPARTLRRRLTLHRVHHANLGPCWFGSAPPSGGGRFDLDAPRGSSYWALRPEAAFLETIARRPISIVPLELLDRYHLTSAPLPRDLVAANLAVQRARAFGLTLEIHTTVDLAVTRAWADALARTGFAALVAIPRHDVTGRQRSVVLFGTAGEHPPFGWRWDLDTGPLPASLVDAMSAWGIRCLPIPFDVETVSPAEDPRGP
jgi:hypothetical protein